jgi:hypothetical protein
MSVRIDRGDLDRLVAALDKAVYTAPAEVEKVVAKGALNIKNGARRRIGRPAHAPAYANSITYDIQQWGMGAIAEIGPDKGRRQGALGNLLEYGSVNNAPIPHIAPAAQEELPRFERAMEDLGEKLLGLR